MSESLRQSVHWSESVRLPVLGIETTFTTNSSEVLAAIEETYGSWAAIGQEVVSPSRATVRIALQDPAIDVPAEGPFTFRVPDPTRMLVLGEGGIGVADIARLESVAYVTHALLARAEFSGEVLEPLTLFLLGGLDRQPLHGAAVARDGIGIVLAGPSGSGKSTLSYASLRRGFTVLSDDAVYIQLRPRTRVWGRRSGIHLRTEARAHFDELSASSTSRLPGGKDRIVIPPGVDAPRYADRVGICLLERGSGTAAELESLTPTQVAGELEAGLEPGFDLYASTIRERAVSVAERGAWRLKVAGTPHQVAACIDDVVAELRHG